MKTNKTALALLLAGSVTAAAQADITDAIVPGLFMNWSVGRAANFENRGLRFGARLDYNEAQKDRLIAAREVLDNAPADIATRVFDKQRMPALLQFDVGPSSPALFSVQGHDLLAHPETRLNASDNGSTWLGRNWGWVLGGVAAAAGAAAVAGGGGGGSKDSKDTSSGNNGGGGGLVCTDNSCVVPCGSTGPIGSC